MGNPQVTALQNQLQQELDALNAAQAQIDQLTQQLADAQAALTAAQATLASDDALLAAANAKVTDLSGQVATLQAQLAALQPAPVTPPPPPPTTTPAQTLPFAIARTGQGYTDFGSAHAAAQDGDTITVLPLIYNVSPDGFSIYKGLTVQSAVAGQKYKLVVAPNSAGAIGSGVGIPCSYRSSKLGLNTRFAVTIQDAEICATALTFVTGKAAVFLDCASGTAPCDLTLRNCYIHDFDQGVEAGNEYDPATRLSTVTIDACDIEQTGDIASGDNNHCLYIGQIAGLTMTNTTVKNVPGPNWTGPNYVNGSIDGPNYWPVGMVVKTRTKVTTIDGCDLTGSANSNLVECGNGGDLLIQNCKLNQGQWSDGNAVISYGRFITATEPQGTTLVANDGRVNRLRVLNNTFVNNCTSKPMQWIELSNTCRQAGAPAVTYQIGGNTFTDSPAGLAIDPTKGYPNLQPAQVFGIPLVIDGSTQTVGQVAQQQPPVTQPPVAQPGSTPTPTVAWPPSMTPVPAWFDATLPNGWSRLPHPAIYSQQAQSAADKANPDDLGGSYKPIVATKGDSAGYVGAGNKPWPYPGALLADGSPAVPGYADFRGDQGMCLIGPDAKFVRRGKVYTGWFVVSPGQGGHGVGLVNQFLVRHVETGLYMDATQQSMPPMGIANATVLGPDGKTQVPVPPWRPDDGRGYSMHDYNAIVPDRKRNRVLWPVGPAQSVGPQSNATLAFGMDGDGWPGPNPVSDPANGKDYFDTSGGAYPNGRNAVACTDCTRDEIYNSFPNSDFVNAVLIAVSSLAQGSKWRWLQVVAGNGDAQIGKASCVSFAMETEPWLVFFSEVSVSHCVILHRDYPIPGYPDRRKYWNVAFQPKGGDPNNVIPSKALDPAWAANVDNGIASTVVFDPVDRLFYAIVFCLDANVLMDVYRITPPAFDPSGADGAGSTFVQGIGGNEVVVPWITEKLAKDPQSVLELPTRGNSSGGFYPSHKTANVVWWYRPDGTRVKGIHFEHDPSRSPIFFRLA